jgi:DNA-binding protein H-NS
MTASSLRSIEDQLEQMEFQANELRRKTEELREQHSSLIIDRIKKVVADLQIAPQQIYGQLDAASWKSFGARSSGEDRPVRRRAPAPPKYRDAQGNTWSGRGKRPHWFDAALRSGKSAEDLLIRNPSSERG